MHILVTSDTSGGVWTYTRELVSGLSKRGVRVTLVSLGEIPSAEQSAWIHDLEDVDFRPTAFRLEWMRDSEDDLKACTDMLQSVIGEDEPDLLHFNHFYFGSLKTTIPKMVVAHSDVLSWWQSVHHAEPKEESWIRWYRMIVGEGLTQATAVVAPSQWMLERLQELYARPKLASVIYNGRTPTLFDPYVTKDLSAASAGRIWDFGKNSALLSKIESPIPVYLAGPDQTPEHPSNYHVFQPRQRLHLKGIQTEKQLRTLFAKASIYIATSQYEPFGMAPVEAALSRCAILASDIPTYRELWGDNACYFRNNDAESLQERLKELSADRDLCATYGKLAYYHAMSRYTANRMVEDYLHLYHALVPAGVMAA
ncbi:MAG TPA: glycosyltransferase family 4 protein [Terriglobales bacterium]|nr:glycosyltransferase family 4 protein [Terriglobales bacterium]